MHYNQYKIFLSRFDINENCYNLQYIRFCNALRRNLFYKAGNTLVHSWHAGSEEFTVSWKDVFISQYSLFYEISVGTVDGGSDVLQWQETTSTSIKFGLPPGFEKFSKLSLHVFVRAISAGGTFEDIKIVIQHK